MKKIPVNIPLNYDGSFNDVFQDFINTMQIVTGGEVDVECSLKGELTIFFGDKESPVNSNKPCNYDIDDLLYPKVEYRENAKSDTMIDNETKSVRNE